MYNINLKQFFTFKTIAQRIEKRVGYQSMIRKTIFKRSPQHPYPVIGIDEITRVVKNVPVVRRGTAAVPMKHGTRKIEYIEPQGVDLSDFLSATDINNLRLLSNDNIQVLINNRIDMMLESTQMTIGALCAQSLTGKIEYPMIADGVNETYEIILGDPCEITLTTKFRLFQAHLGTTL